MRRSGIKTELDHIFQSLVLQLHVVVKLEEWHLTTPCWQGVFAPVVLCAFQRVFNQFAGLAETSYAHAELTSSDRDSCGHMLKTIFSK